MRFSVLPCLRLWPPLLSWPKGGDEKEAESPLSNSWRPLLSRKNGWASNPAGKPHECGSFRQLALMPWRFDAAALKTLLGTKRNKHQ